MSEGYKYWLRLAQAHVLMGCPDLACSVLTTASQLYPNQWIVWRDLSVLSGHCKNFNKMIFSYNKLLDTKESYSNINLLLSLTKHLTSQNSDCSVIDNSLRQDTLNLFSRLVKRDTEIPELWALFGLIEASSKNLRDDEVQRAFFYLEKSVKLSTKNRHWYKKYSSVQNILSSSLTIAEVFLSCCLIFKERIEGSSLLQIIITFLDAIISKVKEEYIDLIMNSLKAEYRPNIEKLEAILNIFKNIEQNLKINP